MLRKELQHVSRLSCRSAPQESAGVEQSRGVCFQRCTDVSISERAAEMRSWN
jgi:hypothetical protein